MGTNKVKTESNIGRVGESRHIVSSSNSMGITTIDTGTKDLGISVTLAIDTSTIGTAIANTRHRVVVGIDTGSTLKSYSITKLWVSLSRDSGNNGGYNNLVMVWYGMGFYPCFVLPGRS